MKCGNKKNTATVSRQSLVPRSRKWTKTDPTSQDDEDGEEVTCAPAWRGRLNSPQLHAHLSRLSDRTRLRRLTDTEWLYHLDTCAGSVLAPHDSAVNVHQRLGNRSCMGGCRLCGTFFDPQLEHGDTCSATEATRGHYACVCTRCSEASNSQIQE